MNATPDLYADIEIDGSSFAPVFQQLPLAIKHSVEQAQPQFTAVFTEDKNGFYINGKKSPWIPLQC